MKRRAAEPAEAPAENEAVALSREEVELEPQDLPKDPYEFVVSQEAHLEASSELWQRIAQRVAALQSTLEGPVEAGLKEFYEREGVHKHTLDKTAKRVSAELAVYALVAARSASTKGFTSVEAAAGYLAKASLSMRSAFLDYVITEERLLNEYVETQFYLMRTMREADEYAEATLMNFMRCCCRNHPDLLNQLHEIYKQGVDETDPRFKELRKMMELNWRQPPGAQFSILQEYPRYLLDHPELFTDAFAETVATREEDKKLRTIRAMAQFAIAASGEEVTPEAIEEMLKKTYERWQDFQEIKTAFDTFVARQVEDAKTKLAGIAGPAQPRSMRSYHGQEELDRMAKHLSVNVLGARHHRKKRERVTAKKMGSAALPTIQEVAAVADSPERVSIEHKLMKVRQTEAGLELVEVDLEEIAAEFSENDGNGLQQDVKRIIAFLKERPINPACSRIRSRSGSIMIEGKPHNLWRFAPNRCQGLSVHPNNRYMRVVHTVVDNNLVIVDVLDHDSFDKKY